MKKPHGRIRAGGLLLCCGMLMISLGACGTTEELNAAAQDVLTHSATGEGKIPITIMGKFGIYFSELEKAAEEKFPNLDLVLINNYTYDSVVELDARLRANDLTDIVTAMSPESVKPYYQERLIDLSTSAFVDRYNISDLKQLTDEGQIYLLPGPAQIRCLVYNKTAFAEMNLEPPKTFDEFVALCKKIEETGIRSLRLALSDDIVAESTINGFGYEPCFSTPADDQWMADYNGRVPLSYAEHMKPGFDNLEVLIDNGLIRMEDFEYSASARITDLVNRNYLITEDGPALISVLKGETDDEFGLMPYYSGGEGSDWVNTASPIYFGLANHLLEKGNEEKYKLALAVLDYISTEEGQQTLFATNIGGISAVKFVPHAPQAGLDDVADTIERGHYSGFWKLRTGLLPKTAELLKSMVAGERDAKVLGAIIDEANFSEAPAVELEPLAVAEADFTMVDTGCLIADMLREETGADLALVPDMGKDGNLNYTGIAASFYQGPITEQDVKRVLPLYISGISREINIAVMTGQDVLDTLESTVEGSETFFYPSGLRFTYAPTAPFEQRVEKVCHPDGTPLDVNKTYTVAFWGAAISPESYSEVRSIHAEIDATVTAAIKEAKTIAPDPEKRFVIVNSK